MKSTTTNQQTKLFKLLVLFASLLLVILFLVGIILTFAHKSLLKKQEALNNQNSQVEQDIDDLEKDDDFLVNEDGEVIIKH
jgi:Tfp pilus assembly protein PilN